MKPRNGYEAIALVTLEKSTYEALAVMYDSGVHMEDGAALLATASGALFGKLQIEFEMHAENCPTCAQRIPAFRDAFLKHFNEAYSANHRNESEKRDKALSEADSLLSKIFIKDSKGDGHES